MSTILPAVDTTAMVLGYGVLLTLLAGLIWLIVVRLDEWRYKRRRARQHDRDWDNLRSAWIFDLNSQRVQTVENVVVTDRVDTDVLEFTVEQIYDYQEEQHRDAS